MRFPSEPQPGIRRYPPFSTPAGGDGNKNGFWHREPGLSITALPEGRVAEWFKAAVLKTAVGASLP